MQQGNMGITTDAGKYLGSGLKAKACISVAFCFILQTFFRIKFSKRVLWKLINCLQRVLGAKCFGGGLFCLNSDTDSFTGSSNGRAKRIVPSSPNTY